MPRNSDLGGKVAIDWNRFTLADETYRRLMSCPGVHTICLGRKEINGEPTDDVVIQVLVTRKLPLEELTPEQVIPTEIQGVATDVIEEQEGRLIMADCEKVDDTSTHRPLQGGIQVQARHCISPEGSGTLGCVAVTTKNPVGAKVLLSNQHVLPYPDDLVGQPSMCSVCSDCCSDDVGKVLRVMHSARVDGAIATLAPGIDALPQIRQIGPVKGTREVWKDDAVKGTMLVQKRGSTTGLTFGTVQSWVEKKDIKGHGGGVQRAAEEFMRITVRGPSKCFQQGGDSGSAIVDMDGNVVGLLFGGTPDGKVGFACPIQFVELQLDIKILTGTQEEPVTITSAAEQLLAGVSAAPRTRELLDTPPGKLATELFERHLGEVRAMLRRERRVTVAWRRGGGPAILQAVAESAATPERALPTEIEGRPFAECVRHIGAAVRPHASPALRADLDRYLDVLAGGGGQTLGQVLARVTTTTTAVG